MNDKQLLLLIFDLYWLRFQKPGTQWYELTDYLRDCLKRDGVELRYTKDSVIYKLPNGITAEFKEKTK